MRSAKELQLVAATTALLARIHKYDREASIQTNASRLIRDPTLLNYTYNMMTPTVYVQLSKFQPTSLVTCGG